MDFAYLFTQKNGRINRKPWWICVLILFVVSLVANQILGDDSFLGTVVSFLILFAGIMVHIKRCHDRGKSGWWCLLLFIPLVGLIWAIIDLGILEGDEGPNEYGPDPLGAGA